MEKPIKPIKPIEPNIETYQTPTEPNGVNYLGEPLYQKLDWVKDYKKYEIDLKLYHTEMEVFEQKKFIQLIKNASVKYCLKSLRITKK